MGSNGTLIGVIPYDTILPPTGTDPFSKLKALIRKVAARTYDDLWPAVGNVCGLFTPEECYNFFKAAGYKTN